MPPTPLQSTPLHREGLPFSVPWLMPPTDSNQLMVPNPDFSFELLGSDLNELWGDWSGADFS